MTELKPCPLCGGDAEYRRTSQVKWPWDRVGCDAIGITVVCTRCGCTIPSDIVQERVAEHWNRRANG